MKTQKVGLSLISLPSKFSTISLPSAFDPNKINNCYAITDKTSIFILLNSSKQHHAPALAKPLKNLATY